MAEIINLRKTKGRAKALVPVHDTGRDLRIVTSVEQNVLNWAKALCRARPYSPAQEHADKMLRAAVATLERAEKLSKREP